MKIYFSAAIYQREKLGHHYIKIVETLEKMGHQVRHEQVTKKTLDDIKLQTNEELINYYRQAMKWVTSADLVVIEASYPSTLNIGHEITLALEKGKPTVVLYKQGFDSFFLHGLNSDKLLLVEYNDDNIAQVVKDSVEFAQDQTDTRFNFFISPKHVEFLDWVAQTKRTPRSVYLRQLIEKDRENHPEYFES